VICRGRSAGVGIEKSGLAALQRKQPERAIMGGLSHSAGGKSMLPELLAFSLVVLKAVVGFLASLDG
jgi:hypothetical protein